MGEKMKIYVLQLKESDDAEADLKFVEDFDRLPAPAQTLGARLQELADETGLTHVYKLD